MFTPGEPPRAPSRTLDQLEQTCTLRRLQAAVRVLELTGDPAGDAKRDRPSDAQQAREEPCHSSFPDRLDYPVRLPVMASGYCPPMRALTRRKAPADELKDAAIEALLSALGDGDGAPKPRAKSVRSLAAGAALYTVGWAAFKAQRRVREQLTSDAHDDRTAPAASRNGRQPTLHLSTTRPARTWVSKE